MDAPIYIHRLFGFEDERSKLIKNRLYVIEDRDGATSGIEEVALTDKDRIGVYDLPGLDDVLKRCSMFITRSRLFIVSDKQVIRHLTFDSPSSSWEKTPIGDDFLRVAGMTVFNSNQMVCFGLEGKNFSLLPHDDIPRVSPLNFKFPFPGERYPLPLPIADTPDGKIYIFWEPNGVFGYYRDGEWHTIDPDTQWPSLCKGAVVVNDKYLITYVYFNPVTLEYAPNLYVCDISSGVKCQWLPEPVMGFSKDDASLPRPDPRRDPTMLGHTNLMQISQDKYAFIWCRGIDGPHPQPEKGTLPQFYMELRCTKFTLSVEDGGDAPHPTFRAHICSHIGCVCDGVTFKIDSTLINPYPIPSSFKVTNSTMLPLKRESEADLDSGAEHKVGSFVH